MAKKVLVADDNPSIRKQLCKMFETVTDYDLCAEATNGEEAIALAKKHRPDLIILDLSMPVMNGLDAARELKKIMPEVPIILFTAYADTLEKALPVNLIVSKTGTNLMSHIRSLAPVENASI